MISFLLKEQKKVVIFMFQYPSVSGDEDELQETTIPNLQSSRVLTIKQHLKIIWPVGPWAHHQYSSVKGGPRFF